MPEKGLPVGKAGKVIVGRAGSVGRVGRPALVVVAVVLVARLEEDEVAFALEVITTGLVVLEVIDELVAGRVVVIKVVELDLGGVGTVVEEDFAGEDAATVDGTAVLRLEED